MNENEYKQSDFTSFNLDFAQNNYNGFKHHESITKDGKNKEANTISRYYCEICQREWAEESEFFVNPRTNNPGMRKKITYFEISPSPKLPVDNSYTISSYFENSTIDSEECSPSIKQRNCRKCLKKKSEESLRNPLITLRDSGIMKPSMKRKLYLATTPDSEKEVSEDKMNLYKIQCKTITEHWTSSLCVSKYCINKAYRYGYCRKCYNKINK